METTTANVATDVLRVDVPEQFIALFGIREETCACSARNWTWISTRTAAK